MKKILLLTLTATLICASVFALSSCFKKGDDGDDTNNAVHTHSFTPWKDEVEATCTTPGKQTRTCTDADCAHVETKDVPALGHSLTSHEKAATCTEDGYLLYEDCSRCDYTTYDTSKVLTKTNHKYVNGVCETCKEPHKHSSWTMDSNSGVADCTQSATQTLICDGCGYVKTEDVPATDHSYDENGVCTECGHNKNSAPDLPDHEF